MIAYFIGLSAGLVPALSTGPVFLTLVQHAITHGFKKAIYFIVGVALTDSTIILLTWMGLSQLSDETAAPVELTLGGGVLLMLFGLGFIIKKENATEEPKPSGSGKLQKIGLFTQAIALNAINPIVWGFWAAISNYAISTFHGTTQELFFFAGVLNMVWITDVLKAYYAQKLKQILTDKFKRYLRIGIGLLLIGFGLKLLLEVVW